MAGAPNSTFIFNLENAVPGNSNLIRAWKHIDFLNRLPLPPELSLRKCLQIILKLLQQKELLFLGLVKKQNKTKFTLWILEYLIIECTFFILETLKTAVQWGKKDQILSSHRYGMTILEFEGSECLSCFVLFSFSWHINCTLDVILPLLCSINSLSVTCT